MSFLDDLGEEGVGNVLALEGKLNGCQREKRPSGRKSVRYDDTLVTVLEYSLDDDGQFPSRPKTPPPRPPTPPPVLGENEVEEGEEETEGEGDGMDGAGTRVANCRPDGEEEDDLFELPPLPQVPPSPPLESRDNPFLPGGDLEKEADDLLKHAVIIRDKFYLDADGNRLPCAPPSLEQARGDGPDPSDRTPEVEETMTAASCANSQAAPEGKRRENGKVSETSPDSVKVDVAVKDALGSGPEEEAADTKDKKKRNKCCSLM